MKLPVLAVAIAALALPCAAQDSAARYAIDLSVMERGVEIASARTVIAEGGQAEVVLTGADGQYTLSADLQLEQGDGGEDRLILEAHLEHDGADLASPILTMNRGGDARIQVGSGRDGAGLTDGIELEVTAIPAT